MNNNKKWVAIIPTYEKVESFIEEEEKSTEELIEQWRNQIKEIGFATFNKQEHTQNYKHIPINQDTKDFLDTFCNIEVGSQGERFYVINNLKFSIIEVNQ